MRRRQLKWLWQRLNRLAAMQITREQLLMKLGAARAKVPIGWRLIDITVDPASASFAFALNRTRLRQIRRREGRYLLRPNFTEGDPRDLRQYYIQLVAVEEAFKNPKGDLAIRITDLPSRGTSDRGPYLHRLPGLLFVHHTAAPPACAGARAERVRSAIEKFAAVQMIDARVPTTDGREPVLTRYTQPEPELQLLINQLKLQLPLPAAAENHHRRPAPPTPAVVKTFQPKPLMFNGPKQKMAPIRVVGLGCSSRRTGSSIDPDGSGRPSPAVPPPSSSRSTRCLDNGPDHRVYAGQRYEVYGAGGANTSCCQNLAYVIPTF